MCVRLRRCSDENSFSLTPAAVHVIIRSVREQSDIKVVVMGNVLQVCYKRRRNSRQAMDIVYRYFIFHSSTLTLLGRQCGKELYLWKICT